MSSRNLDRIIGHLQEYRNRFVPASRLEFICRILPDGSGIESVDKKPIVDDEYELRSLSISNGTYIASGFGSYVVRIKEPTP